MRPAATRAALLGGVCLSAVAVLVPAAAQAQQGPFLYVPNFNDNTVSVIDTPTNATVPPTIAVGANPFTAAVRGDDALVYVTNFNSNNVSVINTATNTVLTTVGVGANPFGVAVSPDGTRAYVTNLNSNTVSVIDTATNTVLTTVGVGIHPLGVAVSPDGTRAYVTNEANNTVSVINTATNTVLTTVGVGNTPSVVAVSPDGTRAYVTNFNSNTVSVINTATNTVLTTVGVGSFPVLPGICSNGNALLASGLTFTAHTSGALACTLGSGPTGASGPVFTGGTLQIAGANIASSLPITLQSQGGIIDTNGNNATLSGAISGPGSLTKIGLGTLTLAGSSTYTGATNVNVGTLQAGATNAFSPFTAFTVASGATLDLNSFNQTIGSLAGAGSVTLGSATLTTGNDNTSTTFSGTISGAGGLSKIGTGTLTLSGPSTYTGATHVNVGTLQAGATNAFSPFSAFTVASGATLDLASFNQTIGSLAGAGSVTLGSATLTTGNDNTSTTFSGTISGTGGLTKIGSGLLMLTGTSSYSGATAVNAGTLIVNGSIANSVVTVNAGAMLAGIGTVGATTIASGGTFAPGNSPGTMTVQGNLAFQSGALYLVQVSPSTASSSNVSGSATLAGTVQAAFASGSYVTRTYTILSAAGGRSGTFSNLTTSNLPAGFVASLSYTATDAILNLTGALGTAGLSGNQANVANALNAFFNNGGTLPPNFLAIFGLTGANLANALTLLSGEAATGGQQVAFQLTNQFLNVMLDPFVDGRSNPLGGSAIGFAPARAELPDDIALAYARILKEPPAPSLPSPASGGGKGGGSVGAYGARATAARTAPQAIPRWWGATISPPPRQAARPGSIIGLRPARSSASRSPAAAPAGASRRGWAAARATRSRPASTARRVPVPPISRPRSPTPTTGCRPTASPLPAIISARASTRNRSAGGWRAAIALRPSTAGSRPTRRCRRRASTRLLIMRATSTPAASPSPSTRATRPTPAASWAGASIACCCSTPRPRSPCARAWPGRTTG